LKRFAPAAFLILLASSPPSSAQDNVNVGAVLRYTGLPTNIQELKDTNVYLRVIESQVASSAIHLNKSRYIDRVSVDAIFNEKNLSEDQAFNVSSGALRGLLGRLDVLIVIDASDDDMARLKAIDLEDGSVRALENCKRGFLGGPSGGAPDCAKGFVLDLVPVIDEIFARKAKRRVDKQQADAANEASRAAQAKAAAAAQRTLDAKTEADTEAAKREQEAREQVLAQHQAEEAKELSERQAAIARLQPNLEGALARLGSANTFWGNMAKSLSERGQTLRSDVQTELRAANMEGQRCQESSRSLDVNSLKQCLAALPAKLDKLDEYK
jgi:flagellar biosynthesis GTPase FlhF